MLIGRGAPAAVVGALVRAGFTTRVAAAAPWTLRFPRDADRDGAHSIDECAFLLLCDSAPVASGSRSSPESSPSWRASLASFSRSTGGIHACVLLQLSGTHTSSDVASVFLEDGTVRPSEASSCVACSGLGRDFEASESESGGPSATAASPAVAGLVRARCACRRLTWLPVPNVTAAAVGGGGAVSEEAAAAAAAADALVSAVLHVRASLSGSKERRQASAARLGGIAAALAAAPPPQLGQQLLTAACLAAVGALPASGVVPCTRSSSSSGVGAGAGADSSGSTAAGGILPSASAAASALADACGGVAQVVAALTPAYRHGHPAGAGVGAPGLGAAAVQALPIGQRESAALAAFFGTDRLAAAVAAAAEEEQEEGEVAMGEVCADGHGDAANGAHPMFGAASSRALEGSGYSWSDSDEYE